jgi:acyl-CoA synthetase (NDP forming)
MAGEDTKVFTAYLDGVRDGRRFFEAARNNIYKKPIVL